ncbi:putative DNA-directed DNA polymerase [Dioscorea sansibarensis]
MKLKPSIPDEYSQEMSAVPLVKPHNFMHPDDHLILEDESGRVKLAENCIASSTFVTAVHRKETNDGDFLVLDVLEAGLPSQKEISLGLSMDNSVFLVPFICTLKIVTCSTF